MHLQLDGTTLLGDEMEKEEVGKDFSQSSNLHLNFYKWTNAKNS